MYRTDNHAALMALNYRTRHDHANNQIIFDFGCGNKIIVDRKTQRAYKIWKNELKDSFDVKDMGITEMESIIISFAKHIPL